MRTTFTVLAAALALVACNRNDEHLPANGAPPIEGGTLELTQVDGRDVAVVSDPSRSSIYVADLTSGSEMHRIVVEGAGPGRIAVNRDLAFVVLRTTGEVATVQLRTGEIAERRHVCEAPRGIDVDPDTGDLWVACAEGTLARLPQVGGEVLSRTELMTDLRDVVAMGGGEVWVSRFRSAQVLVVQGGELQGEPHQIPGFDAATQLFGRDVPPEEMLPERPEGVPAFDATVAWRMRRAGDHRVLVVHQYSQSTQIGPDDISATQTQDVSYGGGGGTCDPFGGGVVRSVATTFDGTTFSSMISSGTTLAVDGAMVDGTSVALAAASEPANPIDQDPNSGGGFDDFAVPGRGFAFVGNVTGVHALSLSTFDDGFTQSNCNFATPNFDEQRPAVAVGVLPDGRVVAQYRDPGEIVIGRLTVNDPFGGSFGDVPSGGIVRISLSGGRVDNEGHALFHEATPSGAACASCHPEGGDDGHVWEFAFGPRRSQVLRGGILDSAPFHWNGEHNSLSAVFDDTFVNRMGMGVAPLPHEVESFSAWLDAVPSTPGAVAQAEAVERGEQVFRDAGCDSCHGWRAVQDGVSAAIVSDDMVDLRYRTIEFQAPALHDMIYRAPYLHNGSAATLEDAIDAMPDADLLPESAKADLAAYLRSI